ncbi:MAG: efflux RND transporter periplasmic adaptor subunit [Candidatus Riflebacteria bacterium]|nr:efflux RND transporter periplasmic adaptor subunit [Candidatus Riflebacteria bacterium]
MHTRPHLCVPWPGAAVALLLFVAPSFAPTARAQPPLEVMVKEVRQQTVPIFREFVGQTKGSKIVVIRAKAEGYLEEMHFTEGEEVKKGQLLYSIESKSSSAKLEQSKADLAEAVARHVDEVQNVRRLKPLADENAVPLRDYESAVAKEKASAATVAARRAAVKQAEVELGYTKIHAPIDGFIGFSESKVGDLVGMGQSTQLNTLSTIDPILVRFPITEKDYLTIVKRTKERKAAGRPPEVPELQLIFADGSVHPQPGKPTLSDYMMDPKTGSIQVEGSFPNPEKVVLPGQYAKIRIAVDRREGALVVPQRAIQELQGTYSVAVVGPDNKIEMRQVKGGARFQNLWIVEAGLKAGERIVVEGLQKVQDGTVVDPRPATDAADATPAPTPGPSGER